MLALLVLTKSLKQAAGSFLRHGQYEHLDPGELGSSAKVDLVLACRVSSGKDCHLELCKLCFHKCLYLSPKCASEPLFCFLVWVIFKNFFSVPESSRLLECK